MPVSFALPFKTPSFVLATGGLYKSTFCLAKDGQAVVSDVLGALDTPQGLKNYDAAITTALATCDRAPDYVACDLHPDFFSTRYAESLGRPILPVQHHHAHIAAVMAEHGITAPVLGLAFDGFGLGVGHESWGGELMRLDASGAHRIGRLRPLPLPGGDSAARAPWRMGAGVLWTLGRGNDIATRYCEFPQASLLLPMMDRQVNCPMTSSAGRLFDAACGVLGVKLSVSTEGEAPMELERLVTSPKVLPDGWTISEKDGVLDLDLLPLLDHLRSMSAADGANLFHGTLIAATAQWVARAAEKTGLHQIVFSGGCFMNRVLRDGLTDKMDQAKLDCLQARTLSPGDAAISAGQAYAALWALEEGYHDVSCNPGTSH